MIARRTRAEQQKAQQRREDQIKAGYEPGFGSLRERQPGGVKGYSGETEKAEPRAFYDLLLITPPQVFGEKQTETERRDSEASASVKSRRMRRENVFLNDMRRSPDQREHEQSGV